MVGSCHHPASEQVRINIVLRVGLAGVRSWRHTCQPQYSHQPLYPLTIDLMPYAAQVYCHLAAAVERVTRVFSVDLPQQGQFLLVRFGNQMRRIDSGTGDACQFTLSGQRQWVLSVYPLPPVLYRLIPDFFLIQSNSIFSRPISE